MNETFESNVDVVIAGAGIAGLLTGILLRKENITTLILEKANNRDEISVGEHLPPIAVSLIRKLSDVATGIELNESVRCSGIRSKWGGNSEDKQSYLFSPWAQYGMNIERSKFNRNLRNVYDRMGGECLHGRKLIHGEQNGDSWTLQVGGGDRPDSRLTCQYLVDATGQSSSVTRQLGLADKNFDDRLVALFQQIEIDCADKRSPEENESAIQLESTSNGWVYSAPMNGNRRVIVLFTCKSTLADSGCSRNDFFRREIQQCELPPLSLRSSKDVERLGSNVQIRAKPVLCSRLSRFGGEGWIAVGDAACSYDPLSSLGIFKAMKSGILAATTICSKLIDQVAGAPYQSQLAADYREYAIKRNYFYDRARSFHRSPFWESRTNICVETPNENQ